MTQFCVAIKRNGDTCTNKAKYGNYCGIHHKNKDDVKKYCIAIQQNGLKCECKVRDGDYCGNHSRVIQQGKMINGEIEKIAIIENKICISKLKDGTDCPFKAKKDQYCDIHHKMLLVKLEEEEKNRKERETIIIVTKDIEIIESVLWTKEFAEKVLEANRKKEEVLWYLSHENIAKLPQNLLIVKRPDLIEEWDFLLNEIDIKKITYGSNISVYWKCLKEQHSYKAAPDRRRVSDCKECYIDSKRVHNKKDKEKALKNHKTKPKNNLVKIGDDTETFIKNLLTDLHIYKSVTKTGNFGGKGDIEIIQNDGSIIYIQIKTLTWIKDEVYYMSNHIKYPDNMLIIMINPKRDRFALQFANKLTASGVELPFNSIVSKYKDIMYKNIEFFKQKLIELIPLSCSENAISKGIKKEYVSIERLIEGCKENGLEFIRNDTNGDTIDGFINGYKIQHKFVSTNTKNSKNYSISASKSAGYLNGKNISRSYEEGDFDFLIVELGGTREDEDIYFGNFCIFPSEILIQKGILETSTSKGKGSFNICAPDSEKPHWTEVYWNDFSLLEKEYI